MDLQSRKLHVIDYLIHLQDEDVFRKIEETIFETKSIQQNFHTPLTIEQLVERAGKANDDYLAGKIKTQEQLEIESEKW
jgi:hypothetical protein